MKKRPEVSVSATDQDLKTNLFQENPSTHRMTLKLHLNFSEDGHPMLKAKAAGEEWPRQLEIALCLQSSSVPAARPEPYQDRVMHGEFFVLMDEGTIVNIRVWFT